MEKNHWEPEGQASCVPVHHLSAWAKLFLLSSAEAPLLGSNAHMKAPYELTALNGVPYKSLGVQSAPEQVYISVFSLLGRSWDQTILCWEQLSWGVLWAQGESQSFEHSIMDGKQNVYTSSSWRITWTSELVN